jgi:hypothetical protein
MRTPTMRSAATLLLHSFVLPTPSLSLLLTILLAVFVHAVQIPALPEALSAPYRRLLQSLVCDDPSRRPTVAQAFRRLACICFGPSSLLSQSECDEWLLRQRSRAIYQWHTADDSEGSDVASGSSKSRRQLMVCREFELRVQYLSESSKVTLRDDLQWVLDSGAPAAPA